MTIVVAQRFPPASSQLSSPTVVLGSPQGRSELGAAKAPAKPVLGSLSKEEKSIAKNVPSTNELPQDVVELHQDPESKRQVIIQYLDQAKNVVLQMPSQQELGVERGIAKESLQLAKLRESPAKAAAGSEGEKSHGNQL
jgi:hypothetical protein